MVSAVFHSPLESAEATAASKGRSAPAGRDWRAFWLVVLPRTIRSLRHVWEHPDFPASELANATADEPALDPVSASRKWIEDFAARIDQTYSRLMSAAENWIECQDYTYDNTEAYKDHWDQFPEFWKHYEIVTGKTLDATNCTAS